MISIHISQKSSNIAKSAKKQITLFYFEEARVTNNSSDLDLVEGGVKRVRRRERILSNSRLAVLG